jgi:hypothetical protein
MAKAGGKFSRYRGATIRGKPILFDRNSEDAIQARLEEVAERLEARLRRATPDQPQRKLRKQQRKPTQEEILRRVREEYPPDGDVGDASVAEVRREISDKKFNPSWDSVNRALRRDRLK